MVSFAILITGFLGYLVSKYFIRDFQRIKRDYQQEELGINNALFEDIEETLIKYAQVKEIMDTEKSQKSVQEASNLILKLEALGHEAAIEKSRRKGLVSLTRLSS